MDSFQCSQPTASRNITRFLQDGIIERIAHGTLGHSFFAFRDEDANGVFAVVYRRNDGDYGVIEDVR